MRAGRIGAEHLGIQSMRKPGQRMPVGHIGGDGPIEVNAHLTVSQCNAGLNVGIGVDVRAVVKVREGMEVHRVVQGDRRDEQKQPQAQRPVAGRAVAGQTRRRAERFLAPEADFVAGEDFTKTGRSFQNNGDSRQDGFETLVEFKTCAGLYQPSPLRRGECYRATLSRSANDSAR